MHPTQVYPMSVSYGALQELKPLLLSVVRSAREAVPDELPRTLSYGIERSFSKGVISRNYLFLPSLVGFVGEFFRPDANYSIINDFSEFFKEYPEIGHYFTNDASGSTDPERATFVLKRRLNAFLVNVARCVHEDLPRLEDGLEPVFNRLADELLASSQKRLLVLPIINVLASTSFSCDNSLEIQPFTDMDINDEFEPIDTALNGLVSCYAKAVGKYDGPKDFSPGHYPANLLDQIRAAVRIGAGLGIRFLWAQERVDSVLSLEKSYAGGGRRFEPSALTGQHVELIDERLESIARAWIALRQSENANTVATAARRLNYGVERERSEDAVTDFVAGMESILTSGDFGEVSFKLRLRLAALIGRNAEDRRNVFRNAAKLYEARSALTHGREAKDAKQIITDARDYLGRLIQAVLERGHELRLSDLDFAIIGGLQGTSHASQSQKE